MGLFIAALLANVIRDLGRGLLAQYKSGRNRRREARKVLTELIGSRGHGDSTR